MLNFELVKHRRSQDNDWELSGQGSDFGWMQLAEPVMQSYTDATDGSSIEKKESAIVWQYRDADPGFGFSQAKEMLDHLESVLANEPVAVKSGQHIVEVKPQVCIINLNCSIMCWHFEMFFLFRHYIPWYCCKQFYNSCLLLFF